MLKEQKSADNFARAHAKYLAKRREWRMQVQANSCGFVVFKLCSDAPLLQYDDHDEYEDEEEDDEFRGRRRRRAGRGGERGAAFNRNRAELARQEEEARRPLKKPKKKKVRNSQLCFVSLSCCAGSERAQEGTQRVHVLFSPESQGETFVFAVVLGGVFLKKVD